MEEPTVEEAARPTKSPSGRRRLGGVDLLRACATPLLSLLVSRLPIVCKLETPRARLPAC